MHILKIEYDSYLHHLIDQDAEFMESKSEAHMDSKRHIERMDGEISELNESCKAMLKKNLDLEKEIEKEEAFRAERPVKAAENDLHSKVELEENGVPKKLTFKEKVEMKRISIIKNVKEINKCKENLKANYVPSVVIGNLNQTIKDIEVGLQTKNIKSNVILILK